MAHQMSQWKQENQSAATGFWLTPLTARPTGWTNERW
jgi:hypothetical protein